MKTAQYVIHLVLTAISAFILLNVYSYLSEAESCPCFVEENNASKYQTNIQFMKFYQLLELASLIVFAVLLTLYKNQIGGKKKSLAFIKFLVVISSIVLLGISGYMGYNVATFYLNMKSECSCVSNKWQKYFVYLEGIFSSIYFLRIIFALVFLAIIVLFNFFN